MGHLENRKNQSKISRRALFFFCILNCNKLQMHLLGKATVLSNNSTGGCWGLRLEALSMHDFKVACLKYKEIRKLKSFHEESLSLRLFMNETS